MYSRSSQPYPTWGTDRLARHFSLNLRYSPTEPSLWQFNPVRTMPGYLKGTRIVYVLNEVNRFDLSVSAAHGAQRLRFRLDRRRSFLTCRVRLSDTERAEKHRRAAHAVLGPNSDSAPKNGHFNSQERVRQLPRTVTSTPRDGHVSSQERSLQLPETAMSTRKNGYVSSQERSRQLPRTTTSTPKDDHVNSEGRPRQLPGTATSTPESGEAGARTIHNFGVVCQRRLKMSGFRRLRMSRYKMNQARLWFSAPTYARD